MTTTNSFADWAVKNATLMRHFGFDADLDELEPLREVIGDARVVALGECSHHVRQFYQVRHRILRFLVERCGFTVYALEAPFTEARVLDAWLTGGPGEVGAIAGAGIAASLGDSPDLHDALTWMRSRNTIGTHPRLSCVGTDLPGCAGSPLTALQAVEPYLRDTDPEALPVLRRAAGIAARFHVGDLVKALGRYPLVDAADRDALSAALSHLVVRAERAASLHRDRAREHSAILHHLRGAWYVDQVHRSTLVDGFEAASTFRDAYIAQSVRRLLDESPSGTRIVLSAHNWHIRKTTEDNGGPTPLLPAGYHLNAMLGDGYRAIGLTNGTGDTAIAAPSQTDPETIAFRRAPLPEPVDGSIEAAFDDRAPWQLADLNAARAEVSDAEAYTKARMADYFLDDRAFDAFDAVAYVHRTTVTAHADH
ncbi:MAG: erythromycin esterase family protein [Stackebrandtia sp.]